MAGEVKERMDECVARMRGAGALWQGGMKSRKRSHGEGRERKGGFYFFKGRRQGIGWVQEDQRRGRRKESKDAGMYIKKKLKQVEEWGELKEEEEVMEAMGKRRARNQEMKAA